MFKTINYCAVTKFKTFKTVKTILQELQCGFEEITSSTHTENSKDQSTPKSSSERLKQPLIKVKSFAIVPQEETKTPAKPIVDKPVVLQPPQPKMNVNFSPGSFLVLRSDAANVDPPLWKIDGKALLQKYNPFYQNGKTLYKNSAEYSGWSLNTKNKYFPTVVHFKQQIKKDHIVELERIKWDEPNDSEKED